MFTEINYSHWQPFITVSFENVERDHYVHYVTVMTFYRYQLYMVTVSDTGRSNQSEAVQFTTNSTGMS